MFAATGLFASGPNSFGFKEAVSVKEDVSEFMLDGCLLGFDGLILFISDEDLLFIKEKCLMFKFYKSKL